MRLCVLARVMRLWRVVSASPKLPLRSSHHSCAASITLPTATLLLALRAITSPIGDTTCACAHYQFLRFPSLVPCIYAPCKRPRTNQRRTKAEPKNSQTPKVLFIKIALSFTSLIPSPVLPTDEREMTERTPTQFPALQSAIS